MHIIIEFVGGPYDGKVLHGMFGEASDAERYYALTNHGTVGQRFKVASDYAVETLAREQLQSEEPHLFQQHYYVVADRLEERDEVLVRAEYIEKDAGKREAGLVRSHLEGSGSRPETPGEQIDSLLARTARSLAEANSHNWPATASLESNAGFADHVVLHFGHQLLDQKFSVFPHPRPPANAPHGPDVVAISPAQDWFLAAVTRPLAATTASNWPVTLQTLREFWLHSAMTIDACADHLKRVAKYCEAGIAIVVLGHWAADENDPTLADWRRAAEGNGVPDVLAELREQDAIFPSPLRVVDFQSLGSLYLLSCRFPIPRPESGGGQ